MIAYLETTKGFQTLPEWQPSCWVRLECPTPEEAELLTRRFKVPPSFLNDISDVDERPRTEMDDDWQLIILRIPHQSEDRSMPFITVPLGIIICNDVLITVCYFPTTILGDFVSHKVRKGIGIPDFFEFFLRLQISSSVWYLKDLKQINHQIRIAENQLERSIKNRELQSLRAQVDALNRQIAQAGGQPKAAGVAPLAPAAEATARLLEAKEQALDLKAKLIRRLSGEGR